MPILSLRGLCKSFGSLKVADEISLDVETGEALGIIGPNGAGKSTLFGLISGTVAPDSGSVIFDGRDVTADPATRRCVDGMGRSFQIPRPFSKLTVFENLLVAATHGRAAAEAEVAESCAGILERTGLAPKANEAAGSLTLLQRKRLELARAMATDPQLLLLDEIAGGLTDAECGALVDTIREIHAEGVTIVWIEHVLRALTSVVERLAALDFGRVVAVGKPAEVMANREVRETYLGAEA